MAERCWRWVKSRAGATKVRNARADKAPAVCFRGESNSVDVVQRAALKARNLQKSHTKKPTKPTEWTIRRPSVGQKIGNNMQCTLPKARCSDAIVASRAPTLLAGNQIS